MSIGVGLGVGIGSQSAPPAGGSSNPNLLLFPEAIDNAVWVKTAATVTPNTGDPTHPNADQVAFGASGSVAQTSTTGATTGATASTSFTLAGVWERQSVTGTFDGVPYTFSAEFLGLGGEDIGLLILRSGAFLKVVFEDASDLAPTVLAWGAKLEQAASFSGYP